MSNLVLNIEIIIRLAVLFWIGRQIIYLHLIGL